MQYSGDWGQLRSIIGWWMVAELSHNDSVSVITISEKNLPLGFGVFVSIYFPAVINGVGSRVVILLWCLVHFKKQQLLEKA